jgi:TatD DNase family protein
MFDTHCHLTDPRLEDQLTDVLARAAHAGVTQMVTVATHAEDWTKALKVAAEHAPVYCAIGVHPNNCHQVEISELAHLRTLQLAPKVVALGEMGLDFHYDDVPRPMQVKFFEAQLQLAAELNRPAIIHCREAVDDCLAVLSAFPNVPADFHCFTGTHAEANRILDRGYMIGFTGVVTFKNAGALLDVVKSAPDDQILVETDAPYLSPAPMRKQKINEPALVVHTAAFVAQLRGKTLEEIDDLTTRNANRFYRT